MTVSATWVSPAAGGALDLATGATITETWVDGVASDLLVLGNTDGRVTQIASASGVASNPTTVSSSFVNLTDMSAALTCKSNSDILVWFWSLLQCTTTSLVGFTVAYDGSDQNAMTPTITVAGGNLVVNYVTRIAAVSAAVHTITGRWSTSAGTLTAGGAQRFLLAMEVRR